MTPRLVCIKVELAIIALKWILCEARFYYTEGGVYMERIAGVVVEADTFMAFKILLHRLMDMQEMEDISDVQADT